MEEKERYSKNCPNCGCEQTYKTTFSLKIAIKMNRFCRSCIKQPNSKIGPFFKNCPICNVEQTYINHFVLENAIKKNIKCNDCRIKNNKRILTVFEINKIISLYESGIPFSNIGNKMGIKKTTIKLELIRKGVFVDGRDDIKIDINHEERNKIIGLHVNNKLTPNAISKIVGVSEYLIRNILKKSNIYINYSVIELSEKQKEDIKFLYLNEYKNYIEISEILGLGSHYINSYLNKIGYRRNMSEANSIAMIKKYHNINIDEYRGKLDCYRKYKLEVNRISCSQPIKLLENFEKRGKSGVDGAYQLDHKYSILEGFKNNISPEIIGNIKNLEFLPWKENYSKIDKCSITITNLIIN